MEKEAVDIPYGYGEPRMAWLSTKGRHVWIAHWGGVCVYPIGKKHPVTGQIDRQSRPRSGGRKWSVHARLLGDLGHLALLRQQAPSLWNERRLKKRYPESGAVFVKLVNTQGICR